MITENRLRSMQYMKADTIRILKTTLYMLTLKPGDVDSRFEANDFLAEPSNVLQSRLRCKRRQWSNLLLLPHAIKMFP
ncbi:hypothetical protein TNCV_4462501 [Trichonephila clavipes]|nr:hypothetical protein TNCV_4462501 [Trichonephila clavipes]